jgi:hypothetical protein
MLDEDAAVPKEMFDADVRLRARQQLFQSKLAGLGGMTVKVSSPAPRPHRAGANRSGMMVNVPGAGAGRRQRCPFGKLMVVFIFGDLPE